MARISIVIPAYNAADFIDATVRSALAGSCRDIEVVVVNDGSSDATGEVVQRIADPRLRLIEQRNCGMSRSRNAGIDASDSEFIALLDADDLWHPAKLEHQLAALSAQPDHDFAYTGFQVWHGEDAQPFLHETRRGRVDTEASGWIYHRLVLDNLALPSSLLWRRSAWQSLGPFLCDDQQTDDWEYIVRASTQHRFLRLAEPYVLYRQHTQSLSKRVAPTNAPERMRESLLSRFGLQPPQGAAVDAQALVEFRYRGWSNFADAHCARGDLSTGLSTFARLLRDGPHRSRTLEKLAKSLVRRVVPRS